MHSGSRKRLFTLSVLIGMMLGRFLRMVRGVHVMSMRHLSMMTGFFVRAFFVMPSSFFVMLGCVLVMLGRFLMVFRSLMLRHRSLLLVYLRK